MDEKMEKKDIVDDGSVDPKDVPCLFSARWALALVGFFGFANLYTLRINMSVAMVCMINNTALKALDNSDGSTTNDTGYDGSCDNQMTKSSGEDGEFVWGKETQGIILGSFFWGYLITQIPGGWLAERFGGKRVLGYFMGATALATLLTPVGARASPYLLIVLRVIMGMGEGVVFPAMHALWSKWAPPLERSKLIAFTYAGCQIGNVVTLPVSALLCEYGIDRGWPSIFYLFGSLGVVWFVAWMFLVSDSPSQHPRISDVERKHIESTIGASENRDELRRGLGTPWLCFLKSKPVWAIIVAHTCANWGTYTLLTNIPAYMKEVLKFDIKSNGAFSAIPYLAFWAVLNISGYVADTLRARGVPTKLVRKIMLICGTILPGAFLVGTGYITCHNPYIAVAILTVAVGFSGCQYPGVMVNHVDIAPPFAGILFGVSNTVATLSGILAPYAIGKITKDQTQAQWQTVFYIAAAIYAVGAIFFTIFADGEIQPWVKPYMSDVEDKAVSNGEKPVVDSYRELGEVGNSKPVGKELDNPSFVDGVQPPQYNDVTKL